ncbi:MAG: L-threonylcarbamoyladenylate synthase [Vicinamibacterales bacterium]
MAEILEIDPNAPADDAIERAAAIIRAGGLVAFPTETVYGLGADATNASAVRRIFHAKGRPATDPLIVHVASVADALAVVSHLPPGAEQLARAFWPGPLTLVMPRAASIGDEVTAGLDTVAVRVPAHPIAQALVRAARVPVAAPSANLFSRPSPTRAEHVERDLGDRIDLIIDGGPTMVGIESTVVDLTVDPPVVLRPGGVTLERLSAVLPAMTLRQADARGDTAMPAPGMLSRHYAPTTPLTLYEGDPQAIVQLVGTELRSALTANEPVVVLAPSEQLQAIRSFIHGNGDGLLVLVDLGLESAPEVIAAHLYDALRRCDEVVSARRILAVQVTGTDGINLAIRDRLRRASAGHIVSVPPGEQAPTRD